jgi:aspartokinase/homoserine dehydrogenase 1
MRKCLNIIKTECLNSRLAVVVSAMGGKPKVTDLLLDLVHSAAARKHDDIVASMDSIRAKHLECINDILGPNSEPASRIMALIDADLKDISDLLRAVMLMKMAHAQILELVSGYGEVWSASIMTAVMQKEGLPFVFLNARDVLFVNEDTTVLWEESQAKLAAFLERVEEEQLLSASGLHDQNRDNNTPILPHLLITGYIASTPDGVATTLKRDGSDYSASIFGRMLKSRSITIWTDVSGVYSADPRRVPEAQILPEVSYTEAVELAYFGAKVIHPKT